MLYAGMAQSTNASCTKEKRKLQAQPTPVDNQITLNDVVLLLHHWYLSCFVLLLPHRRLRRNCFSIFRTATARAIFDRSRAFS